MSKHPVIICYDGSEDAKLAIARAVDLFGDRPAVVLNVWEHAYAQLSYAWPGVGYAPNLDELDVIAQDVANKLAAEGAELAQAAGTAAEPLTVLAPGPVWQTILATAEKRDAAAIVIGSRGLSGIKSMMLGSVSGSVVHHANRPVLIVRHGVAAAPDEPSTAAIVDPISG